MAKPLRRALCWVRRDLRLHDHTPLAEATAQADEVAVTFVFDRNILDALEDRDDRRVTFIHQSLREMDARLRERGSRLLVRIGRPEEEIPRLAGEFGAEAVFAGRDYDPYAVARDGAIAGLRLAKDVVVREAGEVLTGEGKPYRAYGPYQKAWRKGFSPEMAKERRSDLGTLAKGLEELERPWTFEDIGFVENELWTPAGEEAGRARLREFARTLPDYADRRDTPEPLGTSALSVHLRFGTVSIREAVRTSLAHDGDRWLSEIIWREFFQDVLAHFPEVTREAYNPRLRNVRYPGKREHLEAWKAGRTGFPVVDAAMRQLVATGFMPNRMRLLTSSFLCKDLLLDYREGEAHFARFLLDFELANNNGNWQWSASTGTDAQPFFRVFNTTVQGRKYDPSGAYIRRWVPELAELSDEAIHEPAAFPKELARAGFFLGKTYPKPIVDHKAQAARAKALLREAAGLSPRPPLQDEPLGEGETS